MFSNKKNTITKFPVHIGIIMDGNGRWATQKGWKRNIGHDHGLKTLIKILKDAINYPAIKYITLYSLSVLNFKRPRDELESLFNLINCLIIHLLAPEFLPAINEGFGILFINNVYCCASSVLISEKIS